MRKSVTFCEYFVICSATSVTHARAIAEGVEDGISSHGMSTPKKQGIKEATWVVLDFGDVVFHVFDKDARGFYRLEHLWQDAKNVSFS